IPRVGGLGNNGNADQRRETVKAGAAGGGGGGGAVERKGAGAATGRGEATAINQNLAKTDKACVKEALSSGDFKGLIKLIEKGTDVDTLIYENNDQGMRAVHYAAQSGNMEMLRALKQSKVDLKPVTRKGFTALHCAVLNGQLDAVRWLVAEAGLDAACRSKGGETALDLAKTLKMTEITNYLIKTPAQEAIRKGDLGKVRELVAGGFDANAVLQEMKNKECRPLHLAADGGHVDIVKILLRSGAQAEAKNSEGMTPLHLASWGGHAEVIKVLLGGGADGNARTSEGMTAVHLASMGGHVSSMEVLTPTCEFLSVTREGKSALHLAAEYGNLGAVQWLHVQGLDPSLKDHSGQTPLQYAKDEGHKKVVEFLKRQEARAQGAGSKDEEAVRKPLDHRANPERPGDLEGEKGSPDLHTAASVGHVNVMRDLLKAGAPRDTINEMGLQAVHCAAKGGHIEALKLLKESECDLTTRTPQGATTLHCAAEGGHVAAVQWLLEHSGLSLDSLNSDGDTALDVARKNGHHNTTAHLQEAKHQRDLKKLQEEMKEKEHEITRLAAELEMKEEQEKEEIKKLQAMLKSKDEEIKRLSKKQRKGKHQRESKKMDSPE
ncbi:ankyrin-3-like, partial [Penaeus indicus]|uniref:ankyrin-3-like n=1 Tax=Penaeus indicus TaxID=29960 RepID=UPI00300CCC47